MSLVNRFGLGWVAVGWVVVMLGGCTPQGEMVSETECTIAIARATQAWRVNYDSDRSRLNPNNQRIVEFGSAKVVTRNGKVEQPSQSVKPAELGTQENGIWYPAVPPKPSASEMAERRERGERIGTPELYRAVKYTLVCDAGELEAGAGTYQAALKEIRSGEKVRVSYSLGRALRTIVENDSVARINPDPEWTPPIDESSPEVAETQKPAPLPIILYVDAKIGSDRSPGTEAAPLKTITQAISQARKGMTIQVSPGIYRSETGEVFPLKLPLGVTLRGNEENQGQGIQITGGGKFLSPSWAGQNVTLVAMNGSQVRGVSLTNPNLRGTAIWVETGTPVIEANRLVGSDRDGIFASGTATPTIRNNLFEQNGGNGISFTRDSAGTLEGNTIRGSGFGVAISDRATPRLIRNRITQNKDGMVINGEAQPLLTSNQIDNNERDGIVVTNNAKPTLKQNSFRANKQFDLHNDTPQPLKLEADDVAGLKVEGKVN